MTSATPPKVTARPSELQDGFTKQRRHGFGGQSRRAIFSFASRRGSKIKIATSGILGERMAAPVRHSLLLGRSCLPRTTDMAEDDGHLQGGAATARDDRLG
jgi:hypothetical protein